MQKKNFRCLWRQICLVLLAKEEGQPPPPPQTSPLKTMYKTTLGVDIWGVTLTQLALPPRKGLSNTWLTVQAGLAFAKFMSH